ncbi:hypothetical protein JCM11641_005149 [Rhodosporidiobolus odoratus]
MADLSAQIAALEKKLNDQVSIVSIAKEIGSEIAKSNGHSHTGGGARTIGLATEEELEDYEEDSSGLTVSIGIGDLPIPQDIYRGAKEETLIPPLSLLDETTIASVNALHLSFLPHTYDSRTLNAVRKSYEPWFDADHQLPMHKIWSCLLKLSALVQAAICKDEDARKFVRTDFAKFIAEMSARCSTDGLFRVVREYILSSLLAWKAKVKPKIPTPWNLNALSQFSEGRWKAAIVAAGANSTTDLLLKDETSGDTLTAWGLVVNLLTSNKSDISTKVRSIIQEDRIIGRQVLAGRQPEGELPASLEFKHPATGPIRSGGGSYGGGGSSGNENKPNDSGRKAKKPYFREESSSDTDRKGDKSDGVISGSCTACGEPGHFYNRPKRCPKLHESIHIEGKALQPDFKHVNPVKSAATDLYRLYVKELCPRDEQTCNNLHGCTLCGQRGHPPAKCPTKGH